MCLGSSPNRREKRLCFWMVHRFLSETCFLTKFIVIFPHDLWIKILAGFKLGISSVLCGTDREREVSLHGGWAGREGPRWLPILHIDSWPLGRRARKPGLSQTTLLLHVVSKPLYTVSSPEPGLLMWQLRALRKSRSTRPPRSGPENGHNVTSMYSIHQRGHRACPGLQRGHWDSTAF